MQRYIDSTYLLNPLYNAFLAGLQPGLHRMSDLTPDNWQTFDDQPEAVLDLEEEIGFRTRGWPESLQELSLTVDLPDGMMGKINLARPPGAGGFSPQVIAKIQPFYPLFATDFRHLWARKLGSAVGGRTARVIRRFCNRHSVASRIRDRPAHFEGPFELINESETQHRTADG
ncbi:MAG: hypothetical protein OSA49_09215 [Ascidiaceihabitans sp.]|nr:hypothetical protein [Ascidiaceihabitans sp.]